MNHLLVNKYNDYCKKFPINTQLKGKVLSHFDYGLFLDIGVADPDFIIFIDWYNLFIPRKDFSLYPPIGSEIIIFVNCFNILKTEGKIEMRARADDAYINLQIKTYFDILTQKYPVGSLIPCTIEQIDVAWIFCSVHETLYADAYFPNSKTKKLSLNEEVFATVLKITKDKRRVIIKCDF